MRIRGKWLACCLWAGAFIAPAAANAQNMGEPTWHSPLPLVWGQKEAGPYFASELLFWRVDNPVQSKPIATRGFVDTTGQLRGTGATIDIVNNATQTGNIFVTRLFTEPGPAGAFYGTGEVALKSGDVGEESFQPGNRFTIGYRFENDIAVEFVYTGISDAKHTASAGIAPATHSVGNEMNDSFLFIPFYNFSAIFAGPQRDVVSNLLPLPAPSGGGSFVISGPDFADLLTYRGIPLSAYGIWNGADQVYLQYIQRVWNYEVNVRIPLLQTECTRTYAIVGPRNFNIYERFRIHTIDADIDGNVTSEVTPANTNGFATFSAKYDNKVVNHLYGAQLGLGNETYLGAGFALSVETRVGCFADVRFTSVKVRRDDRNFTSNDDRVPGSSPEHAQNDVGISPMAQIGAYLYWYPIEGVQFRAGYEFLGILNVLRGADAIDYNLGRNDPTYSERFLRVDGLTFGVALIF